MKKKRSVPGLDPVRTFPYYKIQVWEPCKAVWIDIQKKFQSVDELREYARANVNPEFPSRIVIVDDYRSRRVATEPSVSADPDD